MNVILKNAKQNCFGNRELPQRRLGISLIRYGRWKDLFLEAELEIAQIDQGAKADAMKEKQKVIDKARDGY